ncbi:hypothetical protein, partial [Arthrobacter sp. SW1]|uniref:hypothetical protein n=1 Tax=Arthrobacter sp. SW1 TaxID=1920889 RepID=UPI001495645F
QAGQPQSAAGLGTEGAQLPARFDTAGASPADRADIAWNIVYIGAYLPAGAEAITVTAAGVQVYRDLVATHPDNPAYLKNLAWAEENLAAREAAAAAVSG